jgi:predicted ATP-grasp superfamily ATP-dependent carboligase
LIQEIIPGDGTRQYSYCAFFKDGQAHSSLVARRLRQHPYEFGRAATYVESTSAPEIESLSDRFLKHINFYGLVEVEYKLDPRDNRYKLLDVNARIWGFHSLGSVTGVDFPYLLFADQTGQTTASSRGKIDVGWLRLIADLPTAFSQLAHRRGDLRSYLQSLRRTRIESIFCKEDPLPSLAEVALLPYLISRKYF